MASLPRRLLRPLLVAAAILPGAAYALARWQGPTTEKDFQIPGTQPNTITHEIASAVQCTYCHAGYDPQTEPFAPWQSSLMANAMRDPLFHACLTIAEQDAPFVGNLCLRCHSPTGWLEGRATPADGSGLHGKDFEGVSCNACHRMVNPNYVAGASPPEDEAILAALDAAPPSAHDAAYVIDPLDRRRGPFDLVPDFEWHEWAKSPFHQQSAMCGTCHDVSNPAFTRAGGPVPAPGDAYVLNAPGAPHPTQLKTDQFPLERSFSEWSRSAFAAGPVEMGGRFGGNKTAVSTCQDCHMPDVSGEAAAPGFTAIYRTDLPYHGFRGAATWVLRAVRWLDQNHKLYGPGEESYLSEEQVESAIAENVAFLKNASDMELSAVDGQLRVRVVNQSGHKLPTGYAEGRRMWIQVRFYAPGGALLAERGAYEPARAVLFGGDTKVYEAKLGLDAAMAAATGLPEGESFHFALANEIVKDNRIPPRGFTNAGFAEAQAAPVGASYADGQYWDDTFYDVPAGTRFARVTLQYQASSREYLEFLRGENHTNNRGRVAWEAYVATGMGAPVAIDEGTIAFP